MRDSAWDWRVDSLVGQIVLAVGLISAITLAGWGLQAVLPGALPGALVLPTILVASLIGGWRSGATAAALGLMTRTFFLQSQAPGPTAPEGAIIVNFILFAMSAAALVAIGVYPRSLLARLRQSRDDLGERNLRYDTLFDTIPEGFAVCEAIRDETGRLIDYAIVEINPALQRLLGVGSEVVGSRLTDTPANWTRWLQVCDGVLTTGEPIRFERFNRVSKLWHEVHLSRLTDKRLAQFFFDITARKAEEARQAEAFDELNHRVKNSLAMVASLLDLQARSSQGQVRAQLVKAASRVQSIAEIHDALSRGTSSDNVDFATYLRDLCASLQRSLAIEDRIELQVETDSGTIPVDTAISLGMVVNELVTNAAKYAYPNGERGSIVVGFGRQGDELVLTVRDHGVGLQVDSDPRSGGLGMRLVRSLLDQLGAEMAVEGGPGAKYRIRLPRVVGVKAA